MLHDARTKPYPKHKHKEKGEYPPLSFDIDVRERVPTPAEYSELLYMTGTTAYTIFLKGTSSTSFKAHPTGPTSLCEVIQSDPDCMRWPIVANFEKQEIAMDAGAVRGILKSLVHDRDGKPKAPEAPTAASRRTPQPKALAWVDYDWFVLHIQHFWLHQLTVGSKKNLDSSKYIS